MGRVWGYRLGVYLPLYATQNETRLAYAAVRWMTTNSHVSTAMDGFLAVMDVTPLRDTGYTSSIRLGAHFDFNGRQKSVERERECWRF